MVNSIPIMQMTIMITTETQSPDAIAEIKALVPSTTALPRNGSCDSAPSGAYPVYVGAFWAVGVA
jgi:hypothetical protein